MPSINGISNNPAGRPKGIPNKLKREAQEIIVSVINDKAERLSEWIEEIYRKDGAKHALAGYIGLLEFAISKKSRVDVTGDVTHRLEATPEDRAILDRYVAKRAIALQSSKVEVTEAEFSEVGSSGDDEKNAPEGK